MTTPPESDPGQTASASPEDVDALLDVFAGIGKAVEETFAVPNSETVLDGFQNTDLDVHDYSYNPEEITSAAQHLQFASDDIVFHIEMYEEAVFRNTQGWKGMSGDVFVERHQTLAGDIRRTQEWLYDASTYLISMAEDVRQQDRTDSDTLDV
ncbi:WXG100 family type VII secretion target [Streptomyces sp. NPDC056632]|uniref:WXG100 family type VII secretion target n=1 Tax=Streptomyces sp. NPDC056632 TaxID=3345884 RepID=UPI0036A63284